MFLVFAGGSRGSHSKFWCRILSRQHETGGIHVPARILVGARILWSLLFQTLTPPVKFSPKGHLEVSDPEKLLITTLSNSRYQIVGNNRYCTILYFFQHVLPIYLLHLVPAILYCSLCVAWVIACHCMLHAARLLLARLRCVFCLLLALSWQAGEYDI